MEVMYEGQVNSPQTILSEAIDNIQTEILVEDASLLPEPPNILTIGYDFPFAETVKYISRVGNTITVERAFQGTARAWGKATSIARVFTEYDYDALRINLEELIAGTNNFITTSKFISDHYVYFVGLTGDAWRVNRYDIYNNKTTSTGSGDSPSSLIECEALTYE